VTKENFKHFQSSSLFHIPKNENYKLNIVELFCLLF